MIRRLQLVGLQLLLLAITASAQALPHNARQTAEGYWVGGLPELGELAELHQAGVRLVVSSVQPTAAVLDEAAALGMTQIFLRMGSTFRRPHELLRATEGWAAGEIYVHCDHGGDRAGAMLALLLVVRDGWEPDHALLAVAYPGGANVRALTALIEAAGLDVDADEQTRYAGIYSGRSNGGTGGLKAIGERYENLVTTTLEAFQRVGIDFDD